MADKRAGAGSHSAGRSFARRASVSPVNDELVLEEADEEDGADGEEPEALALRNELLELAEEPGLWLPGEPKLMVFRGEGFAFIAYGRSAWVHRLRLEEQQVEPTVNRIAAMLGLKGLPEATWWVGELSTPSGLADRLGELGLEPGDPPEMVSFTIAEPPAGEPTVEVRRAETLEEMLAALEIDWASFEIPQEERELRRREAELAWPQLQADGRQSTYVAYEDGEPVGFGRAVFTPRRGAPARRGDAAAGARERRLHLDRPRTLGRGGRARRPPDRGQRRAAVGADPRAARVRADRAASAC